MTGGERLRLGRYPENSPMGDSQTITTLMSFWT
jgi:hypothetical protein